MPSLATFSALLEGNVHLPGRKHIFHFLLVKANLEVSSLFRQLYTVPHDYNLGPGF